MLELFITKQATEEKGLNRAASKKSRRTTEGKEQELEHNSNYTVTTSKRKVDNRGSVRGQDMRSNTFTLSKLQEESSAKEQADMQIPGKFILLTAANIFLSRDFEYCLRICSTNFSYVANSSLFEGNILRFRALASEQLFSLMRLNQEAN